jgi:competence protein ComEC
MCGIAFQLCSAQSLLIPAIIALLIFFIGTQIQPSNYYIFFISSAFILGSILYEKQRDAHWHVQHLVAGRHYDITATITDIDLLSSGYLRNKITLSIDSLNPSIGTIENGHRIIIYTNKTSNLWVGDTITIARQVFKSITNDSYNIYLTKEGVATTIFATTFSYTLIYRPHWCLNRWIHKNKHRVLDALRKKMSKNIFTVAALTFYGSTDTSHYYKQHIKEGCRRWGISHLLARSGLHLVIFVMLWQWILTLIPLSYRFKQIIMLVLGIAYYIFSWPGTSFNRAFLTFFAHKVGAIFYIQTDLMHLLTVVCFCVLLYNPMQLLFLDFQLTFALTAGLALINHATTHQYFSKTTARKRSASI